MDARPLKFALALALLSAALPAAAEDASTPPFPERWRAVALAENAREAVLVERAADPRACEVLFVDRYGALSLLLGGRAYEIARSFKRYAPAGAHVVAYTVPLADKLALLYAWAGGKTLKLSDAAGAFAVRGDGSIAFVGAGDAPDGLFLWTPGARPIDASRKIADDVDTVEAGVSGYFFRTLRPDRLYLAAPGGVILIGDRLRFLADSPAGLIACEDRRGDLFLYDLPARRLQPLTRDGRAFAPGVPSLGEFKLLFVDRNQDLREAKNVGAVPVLTTVQSRGSVGVLSHYAYDERGAYEPITEEFAVLARDAEVVSRDDRGRLLLWTGSANRLIANNVASFCVDLADGKVLFRKDDKLFLYRAGEVMEAGLASVAFVPLRGARVMYLDERRRLYLSSEGRTQPLLADEEVDATSLAVYPADPAAARRFSRRIFHVGLEALTPANEIVLLRTARGRLYLLFREEG
ncbi:MAG: hypothetical protein V2A58_10040 [Planctomycetota bacterium]